MVEVLLPAALGAGSGLLYANQSSADLNQTSAAIAGTAVGLGIARVLAPKPVAPTQDLALAVSIVSLVAYDRWYDGLWPFAQGTPSERKLLGY